MQNFKEQINKIATDLLNLEINTIIKPNILGTKMSRPRHALLDIAKMFDSELTYQKVERLEPHNDLGGYEAFDQLRERANQRILELERKERKITPDEEANLLMLYRIKDKSDQIKGIFNSLKTRITKTGDKKINIGGKDYDLKEIWDNEYTREQIEGKQPPFPLIPDELVLIRKIWEMGTEEIAMQTIIQLDGDVVTRVQPKYVSSNHEVIHNIHNQGVNASVSFWKELVGIVQEFFNTIVKIFF